MIPTFNLYEELKNFVVFCSCFLFAYISHSFLRYFYKFFSIIMKQMIPNYNLNNFNLLNMKNKGIREPKSYEKMLKPILLIVFVTILRKQSTSRRMNPQFAWQMEKLSGRVYCVSSGCFDEKINQGRSFVDTTVDVFNCFFQRSSEFSGNGGVIYVNVGSINMNITYCMFYNCSSSSTGGAIWFCSLNSYIRMVCANRCDAASCPFAYLQASLNNVIEYLSMSLCSYISSRTYTLYFYTGNQRADNINSSMNSAYHAPGIWVHSSTTFSSARCTFSNNIVSNSICIWFNFNAGTMSFANVVHNNSPSNWGVVCVSGGSPKMHYCVFDMNKNTLFSIFFCSIDISHIFIYLY